MVVSHRSIVAGAVLLVASAAGASADYYRGMKDMPIATMQPASWYVRGDYSYSWMDADELSGAISRFGTLSIDNNWALGGGVGYYFGRGVRGDLTYEWRAKSNVNGGGTCSTDFDMKSSLLLANLYYDFRPYERFTPYVGVGLGAVHHRTGGGQIIDTGCGTPVLSYDGDSNWSAAGAAMAGFSIRLDRGSHHPVSIKDAHVSEPGRLHLDVGYRFLYLGDAHAGNLDGITPTTPGPRLDDVTAQEIRVGLRWDIR
jgi:opacity protein-like surface antigen